MSVSQKNIIKHNGIVTKVSAHSIFVRLIDNTNCAGCNAKASCGVSKDTTKDIEVLDRINTYALHEVVSLTMKNELGLKAVFLAYVLPFMILFLSLIISLQLLKEWQAGLLSIFMLFPYFLIIYLLKNTLATTFSISINKQASS